MPEDFLVEVFLRVEADMLVFAFGLAMLIRIRLKAGKLSYETNWLTLLLSLILLMQLLLSLFWALSVRKDEASILLRDIVFFVYYIINDTVPLLWVIFVHIHIHHGKKKMKILNFFIVPFCLSMLLLILNPSYGDIFTIDSYNNYHIGGLFYLNAALCYFYIFHALIIPIANRKNIESRHYIPIILFGLLPLIGSVIQFTIGGIDLIWASAVLSLMIMYFRILNNKMNIDYLTGLYNRMQADQYVSAKIEKSVPGRTFSGVMIDVDKFKEINDKCGHHAGDEALEITANLLRKCVGKKDFIARQGGDEFIIILDTDDITVVNQITDNIDHVFENYNRISQRPFDIKLSMGYDVYDYSLAMTRQQFIRHIDRLMYRRKRTHRLAEESVVGGFSLR